MPGSPGGGFTPGWIGKTHSRHEWEVYSTVDIRKTYYFEQGVPIPLWTNDFGNAEGPFRFYYDNYDDAEKALSEIDTTFAPHMIHVWQPLDDILWRDAAQSEGWRKRGDSISSLVKIAGTGSNKWHEAVAYNMLYVPVMIEAAARAQAQYIDYDMPEEPIFDLSGIRDMLYKERMALEAVERNFKKIEPIFTDEVSYALAGKRGDFANSELWQKRAQLFLALGEPDPMRYKSQSAEDKKAGKELAPYETESPALLACSRAIEELEWGAPIWTRFELFGIPTIDGGYESKSTGKYNRLSIPLITEIFLSDEDAEAAFAANETGSGGTATPSDIPPSWSEFPDKWYEQIAEFKTEFSSPDDIPEESLDYLDCTRAQVAASAVLHLRKIV